MNNSPEQNNIMGLVALRQHLEMNLLMQSPQNYGNFLYGTNPFGGYMNHSGMMQMSGLNAFTSGIVGQQTPQSAPVQTKDYRTSRLSSCVSAFKNFACENSQISNSDSSSDLNPPKVGENKFVLDSLNSLTTIGEEINQNTTLKSNGAFKLFKDSDESPGIQKGTTNSLEVVSQQVDSSTTALVRKESTSTAH